MNEPTDLELLVLHRRRVERVLIDADFYASLGSRTITWPDYSKYPYVVDARARRVGYLHVIAWEFSRGIRVPLGCVVHHLSGKRDARARRLELLTQQAHATIHRQERGKRTTARARPLLRHERGGAPPRTLPRPASEEQQRQQQLECELVKLLPGLLDWLAPDELQSNRIPPAKVQVRLAATAAEASVALLSVVYCGDLDRIVRELALREAWLKPLKRLAERLSTRTVIERWREYRRLPWYALRRS